MSILRIMYVNIYVLFCRVKYANYAYISMSILGIVDINMYAQNTYISKYILRIMNV